MWLLIGDLHLTDNVRDAYRFGVFDWIKQLQKTLPIAATFLAGDLTDSKDRHPATLVNKVVTGLLKLKPPVYIDRGNHDYRDPDNPFFKFLSHIEGLHFVCEPTLITHKMQMGIIPHYREQAEFDAAVKKVRNTDCYLVHQTFDGAIAETGAILSGLRASPDGFCHPRLGVLAGDVHKPQRQGIVTYIGCPYHVRFGDGFNPRVLFINEKGKRENLYFDAPFKWSLTVNDPSDILNNKDIAKGDQVKLTVQLMREEAVEWKQIKANILAACREVGVDVYGCKLDIAAAKSQPRKQLKEADHSSILEQFCKLEKTPSQMKKAGMALMEKLSGN